MGLGGFGAGLKKTVNMLTGNPMTSAAKAVAKAPSYSSIEHAAVSSGKKSYMDVGVAPKRPDYKPSLSTTPSIPGKK